MSRLLDDWGASTSLLKMISGNETEVPSSETSATQAIQNDGATRVELDLDDLDSDEVDEATTILNKQSLKQPEEKPKIQHPYVVTRCAKEVTDIQREWTY
jgi:hypothetical protein